MKNKTLPRINKLILKIKKKNYSTSLTIDYTFIWGKKKIQAKEHKTLALKKKIEV